MKYHYYLVLFMIGLFQSCAKQQLEVESINGANLPLYISNLDISSHTSSGFTASVKSVGGSDASGHTLFYCNETISPGCDPLVGLSIVMIKSGVNQVAVLAGLSNPTNDFNLQVVATDANIVIGSPLNSSTTLLGTGMEISNFTVTNANKLGMDVTVDYTGDTEANATVTLYYCNDTDSPSCDPFTGAALVMNRNVADLNTSLTGLPTGFDEGDKLNFSVIVNDTETSVGSPMSAVDYLADMRLTGISTTNVVETGFDLSVNITETNVDGTANAYYTVMKRIILAVVHWAALF